MSKAMHIHVYITAGNKCLENPLQIWSVMSDKMKKHVPLHDMQIMELALRLPVGFNYHCN